MKKLPYKPEKAVAYMDPKLKRRLMGWLAVGRKTFTSWVQEAARRELEKAEAEEDWTG